MRDDPLSVCPECQGSLTRLLYPVGIVFKGSGWYITDSRKPEKSESATIGDFKSESKKDSSSDTNTDGAAQKPEGKAAAPAA
jgi:predicted nucleic acid-binding Zn ribbon protein